MIYFITDGQYIKIGKSKNPIKRLKNLQTSNAKTLRFIYIFNVKDSYEKRLHKLFKNYQTNSCNEWFDLSNTCIKTKLNYINCPVLKDNKQASHKAELFNKELYGNLKDFRNIKNDLGKIKSDYYIGRVLNENKNSSNKNKKITNLLNDIKKDLLNKKRKISYKPYIKKYGFTQPQISFYVKSAGLSKKVYKHNNK